MIKNVILTGDTHGGVQSRLKNIQRNMPECKPEETAVIILGDAGLNYWLDSSDKKRKRDSAKYGYTIYCVRGNHEERPENLGYRKEYDENVRGDVYVDDFYDNIRYFVDGGEYRINGHSCLVLGGAYSVDKWYRLAQAELTGKAFSGWFADEMLTAGEMEVIGDKVANKEYDFVFSHTCPISWEPTDLFLGCIDQSKVDKSMEQWMDKLRNHIGWGVWCFGHFHADRLERPHVEQFYNDYENMETIWERWRRYDETNELDWWLPKSPHFYWE